MKPIVNVLYDMLTEFSRRLGDLVCDAGCVLQDLDAFLGRAGFQVESKMICRIASVPLADGLHTDTFGFTSKTCLSNWW